MSEAPSTQTPTGEQPDPAIQAAVTAQMQQDRFGMSDGEENRSAAEPKTDHPEGGTTPTTGPEGSTQSTSGPKFFGKYETIEAAEQGYRNMVSESLKHKQRAEALDRELALAKVAPVSTATAETTLAAASSAEDFRKDPQVQTLLQKVEEVGGKELVAVIDGLLQRIESKSSVPNSQTQTPKAGEPSAALDKALELAQQHFSEAYPELATGEQAEQWTKYLEGVAKATDPYANLELMRSAFLQATEAERLDKAITEARADERKKAVEERDKHWKSIMVSNGLTVGTTGPGEGGQSDLKTQQAAHFGMSD